MPSPASPNRKPRRALRVALCGAVCFSVALGAGSSRAQAAEPPSSSDPAPVAVSLPQSQAPPPGPFADRFPDMVLKTHEGKNVRFYEDLMQDKIVLINFMYATCEDR